MAGQRSARSSSTSSCMLPVFPHTGLAAAVPVLLHSEPSQAEPSQAEPSQGTPGLPTCWLHAPMQVRALRLDAHAQIAGACTSRCPRCPRSTPSAHALKSQKRLANNFCCLGCPSMQVQRSEWTRFFSMFIVVLMWLVASFVLVLAIDFSLVGEGMALRGMGGEAHGGGRRQRRA